MLQKSITRHSREGKELVHYSLGRESNQQMMLRRVKCICASSLAKKKNCQEPSSYKENEQQKDLHPV